MRGVTFVGTCRAATALGFVAFLSSLVTLKALDTVAGPVAYPDWRLALHTIGRASLPAAVALAIATLATSRRWTLAQAGCGIAGVAVVLGVVLGASPNLFIAMRLILVAGLAMSLLAAMLHRGHRCMWAGFGLFGWGFYLAYVAWDDPMTHHWSSQVSQLHFQISPLVDAICPRPEGIDGGWDRQHPAREVAFHLRHASTPLVLPPRLWAFGWQEYRERYFSTASVMQAWLCVFFGCIGAATGQWLVESRIKRHSSLRTIRE